jgi:hypothetical protein
MWWNNNSINKSSKSVIQLRGRTTMRRDIETCRLKGFNVQPIVTCDDAIVMAQVHGLRNFKRWPIVC